MGGGMKRSARASLLAGALPLLVAPANGMIGTRGDATWTGNPCGTATGMSAYQVTYYQGVVTATDSAAGRLRNNLGLVSATSNSVTPVTDSATCWRARNAYVASLKSDTLHVPTVWVIKGGPTRYVITDFVVHYGEWTEDLITDTTFVMLGAGNS
jgi:hypothetical protein